MGTEKESGGGGHGKDATHVVQATDSLGRTVGRDAFKSQAEAESHAEVLKQQGHKVDISPLVPQPAFPASTSKP